MRYKWLYTSNFGFKYQGICFDRGQLIEKIRFRTTETWKAQIEQVLTLIN